MDNKKNKLAELAARKRKEQEAAAAEEQQRKKQKKQQMAIDFGDSDEEEEEAAVAGEQAEDAGQQQAALQYEPETEEDRNYVATQEDRDFIDDTGLAEDERIDFADDADQLAQLDQAQEAQEEGEEDELDKVFNKAKRRQESGFNDAEQKRRVDSFLASMEVAAEQDFQDFTKGKPAVHKLRMLPQLEEMVATKRLHTELLDAGLLGVLRTWLDPMSDGTLPNVKVRETLLRLLHQLPVDCSKEDRKDQLKRSGLGRVVMFYYKLPDETAANRRMAKELVEAWSRPILAQGRREMDAGEEQRILEARRLREARQKALAGSEPQQERDEEGQAVPLKKSDPGFRWHAAIPQAASLDYVRAPKSKATMPEQKRGGSRQGEHKLSKKLATLGKGSKSARASQVSVEGRNVMVRE